MESQKPVTSTETYSIGALPQVIAIACTSLVFFIALNLTIVTSNPLEKPRIMSLTPEKLEQFGGDQSVISVGFYIRDILKFDVIKNEYIFTGTIWFEFDPKFISLDVISKFSIDRADVFIKSAPEVILRGNRLLAKYWVYIKFGIFANFKRFPVDDHAFYLALNNFDLSISQAVFESAKNDFVIVPDLSRFGWSIVNKEVDTGYTQVMLNENDATTTLYSPEVTFNIFYSRIGTRYSLSMLFPILLLFFLATLTFSMNPATSGTLLLSISAACMTALLAYKFVLENMSPIVGYFTLADYTFFLVLIAVFIVFFINIFSHKIKARYKLFILCMLHILVSSSIAYLLLVWNWVYVGIN